MEKDYNEIIQKIRKEAEGIDVPDALSPVEIKKKLEKQKSMKSKKFYRNIVVIAAMFAVIILGSKITEISLLKEVRNRQINPIAYNQEKNENSEINNNTNKKGVLKKQVTKKQEKIGNQFYLAKNYEEVTKYVQDSKSDIENKKNAASRELLYDENGIYINSADEVSLESSKAESEKDTDYSLTNTMEEAVDEADFVKMDENYIYVCKENEITILNISGEKMRVASRIKPDFEDDGSIKEIYLDKDKLMVIYSLYSTNLEEGKTEESVTSEDMAVESSKISVDCLYVNNDERVALLTYDISNRSKPELEGKIIQEGSYNTSRKIEDIIYLFTNKYDSGSMEQDDIIPKINGKAIAEDSIYLSKDSSSNVFIASSVNIFNPSKTIDNMAIFEQYWEMYMSEDAIYLYREEWKEWENKERKGFSDDVYSYIAKFSYMDGILDAEHIVKVKGKIEDSFAIHSTQKGLQILTTRYDYMSDKSSNNLYLFDKNLKKKAVLDNIAPGEEIYAARFIGDIVYFITYHNTDPLFAVDISNYANPKIIGSLKITGFSDYLHPYGESMLLGMGYETDPETGEYLGVKLVMFDISDPENLKVLDSVIIEDIDYAGNPNDYKTVLADSKKNLIGMALEKYNYVDDNNRNVYWRDIYQLYEWKDGKFQKIMNKKLDLETNYMRAMYCKTNFFILSCSGENKYILQKFDMNHKCKEIGKISF